MPGSDNVTTEVLSLSTARSGVKEIAPEEDSGLLGNYRVISRIAMGGMAAV